MSIFLFRDYYLVTIMLYREYPEKSFKSFSLLANALPIGIPAEGIGLGNSSAGDWNPSAGLVFFRFLGIGFPEG